MQPKPAVSQPLCLVVDIGGLPAAAVMLAPAPAAGTADGAHALQVQLAAVFPDMEQSEGVAAALLSYALAQLRADGATTALQQGNTRLLPALAAVGALTPGAPAPSSAPDAPLLTLSAAALEGDSAPAGAAAQQPALLEHSLRFAPGVGLDGLAAALAGSMQDLSAAAPTDAATAAAAHGVLHAARRISQQWQAAAAGGGGPSRAGSETAAAAEVLAEVSAVVAGFMEAAGYSSERLGCGVAVL